MLDLVVQKNFRKYRVINYWIQQSPNLMTLVEYKILGHTLVNGGVVELGKYSSLEKAKKVFEEMIKAEEKQKSIDIKWMGVNGEDFGVSYKYFKIYKMPKDDKEDK